MMLDALAVGAFASNHGANALTATSLQFRISPAQWQQASPSAGWAVPGD